MIPPFEGDLLPIDIHVADPAEVERRFVQDFPASFTRSQLYRGWRTRRDRIATITPILYEWLDGSYVTTKRDPSDTDVTIFLDGSVVDGMTDDERRALNEHIQEVRPHLAYGCHTFPVFLRPAGHPAEAACNLLVDYWRTWWGHSRDGRPKGFLEVRGEP